MNQRVAPWALVIGTFAIVAGCSAKNSGGDPGQGEDAFTQEEVDNDPTLKALQARAANVNEYEINVNDIDVPIPNASVGTRVNGFSTRGLDWFKNPNVHYPDNKQWDQGTNTGKKCQWASIFRFHAIFAEPPAEAIAMRDLSGSRWYGSFWSWIDDYASTNSVRQPTPSYAWAPGLWKWIGASGRDGLCRLPTKTMVARMMTACMAQATANDGDATGCSMPSYDPEFEPPPAAPDGGTDNAGDGSAPGRDSGAGGEGADGG